MIIIDYLLYDIVITIGITLIIYYMRIYIYTCIQYELQPKFSLMERSIRDIFIFFRLSWGLENDNRLCKKR